MSENGALRNGSSRGVTTYFDMCAAQKRARADEPRITTYYESLLTTFFRQNIRSHRGDEVMS